MFTKLTFPTRLLISGIFAILTTSPSHAQWTEVDGESNSGYFSDDLPASLFQLKNVEQSGSILRGILTERGRVAILSDNSIAVFRSPDISLSISEVNELKPLWTKSFPEETETKRTQIVGKPMIYPSNPPRLVYAYTEVTITNSVQFEAETKLTIEARNLDTGAIIQSSERILSTSSINNIGPNIPLTCSYRGIMYIYTNNDFTNNLVRVSPTDLSNRVERPIDDYVPEFVRMGGSLFSGYDSEGLVGFDSYDTEEVFTFTEDQMRENIPEDAAYGGFSNIIRDPSNSSRLYMAYGGRVFSLTTSGEVVWKTDLDPEFVCTDTVTLSANKDVVVVNGLCYKDMVALDAETGEVLWQQEVDGYFPNQPLITDNTVYTRGIIYDYDEILQFIDSHSLSTGEKLSRARLSIPGAIAQLNLNFAAGSGYLFVGSVGAEDIYTGQTVTFMEALPVQLGLSNNTLSENFQCSIREGMPIRIPVRVKNDGPGTATNTYVDANVSGVSASVSLIDKEDNSDSSLFIGDVEPQTDVLYWLEITPFESGTLSLSASLISDQRDLSPKTDLSSRTVNYIYFDLDVATAVDTPNLEITGIEVTQVTQDMANSLPLVKDKPTLIRVYAKSDKEVEKVPLQLLVDGVPVTLMEPCINIGTDEPDRADFSKSYNYLLDRQLGSSFTLEASIDPDMLLKDPDLSNNTMSYSGTVEELPEICLCTFRVRTNNLSGNDNYTPNRYLDQAIVDRAEAMLPTSKVNVLPYSKVLQTYSLLGTGPHNLDPESSFGRNISLGILWTQLWWNRITDGALDPMCRDAVLHYVGMVGEDNYSSVSDDDNDGIPDGNFNGIALFDSTAMMFRVRDEGDRSSFRRPSAGVSLAHEIGHNYDRRHVDCGNPDGPDENYPYNNCQLGPVFPDAFYGTDLMEAPERITILDPILPGVDSGNSRSDLMSYAGQRWPSDYTYLAMFNEVKKRGQDRSSRLKQESQSVYTRFVAESDRLKAANDLLMVAIIQFPDGTTVLETVQNVPSSYIREPELLRMAEQQSRASLRGVGTPRLQLLDGSNNILEEASFDFDEMQDDGLGVKVAGVALPLASASSIRVVNESGTTLVERTVSSTAPTISQVTVTPGIDITVNWQADDADDDDLTAVIQYSTDNGATWSSAGINIPGKTFTFDASLVKGTNGNSGLIRVIVSDGFNSAEGVSNPFTLADRAPVLDLARPTDGLSIQGQTSLVLQASAFDPEYGDLSEGILWQSDLEGVIGIGSSLTPYFNMPGLHTITASIEDSAGNTTTASVEVFVGLPPINLTLLLDVLTGRISVDNEATFDANMDTTLDGADIIFEP